MTREPRTYEESFGNGVVAITHFAEDGEIRYSVVQNGKIVYNEAMSRYSVRLAAKHAREQLEVATRLSR